MSIRIILDPGHGGRDQGVIGSFNGQIINEPFITLLLANKIKYILCERYHIQEDEILITRTEDKYLSVENRIKIIQSHQPEVTITIHLNASSNSKDYGFSSFIFYKKTEVSEKLLHDIHEQLIEMNNSREHAIKGNRGMLGSNNRILKEINTPIVQVELGFLSNQNDLSLLIDQNYQDDLSACIAQGISNYLQLSTKEGQSPSKISLTNEITAPLPIKDTSESPSSNLFSFKKFLIRIKAMFKNLG